MIVFPSPEAKEETLNYRLEKATSASVNGLSSYRKLHKYFSTIPLIGENIAFWLRDIVTSLESALPTLNPES